MTDASPEAQVADEFCEDCGYEPELKRTLGPSRCSRSRSRSSRWRSASSAPTTTCCRTPGRSGSGCGSSWRSGRRWLRS